MEDGVIDVIGSKGIILPVVQGEKLPLDILERQNIIDRIMNLLEAVSAKKGSYTFSLNGVWGSGKTFVLSRLEKQLREYRDGDKYLVFHYNCWQYDYYEEPVVAIVSAMIDCIEEQMSLFSPAIHEKTKKFFILTKSILINIAEALLKNGIGVDLTKNIKDAVEGTAAEVDMHHEYDSFYGFKKVLDEAKKNLSKLTEDKTLVVTVDELDRCLPDYAIKVMERLHHLFFGLNNAVVILSVDKGQLDNTVKQIFGENTDTDTYLKKFINFEIALDIGEVSPKFRGKYSEYSALFDRRLLKTDFPIDKFISALFSDIDIRTQERLMERILVVHTMLFPGEKRDYSFMCFELMWLVFSQYYHFNSMPIQFEPRKGFSINKSASVVLKNYISEEWTTIKVQNGKQFDDEPQTWVFTDPVDIPQLLIWYLQHMYQDKGLTYQLYSNLERPPEYKSYVEEFKKIEQLLAIIN